MILSYRTVAIEDECLDGIDEVVRIRKGLGRGTRDEARRRGRHSAATRIITTRWDHGAIQRG